jgi:hypothetical protein
MRISWTSGGTQKIGKEEEGFLRFLALEKPTRQKISCVGRTKKLKY